MLLAETFVDGEVAVLVGVGMLLDLLAYDGGGADGGEVVGWHFHASTAATRGLQSRQIKHEHNDLWKENSLPHCGLSVTTCMTGQAKHVLDKRMFSFSKSQTSQELNGCTRQLLHQNFE